MQQTWQVQNRDKSAGRAEKENRNSPTKVIYTNFSSGNSFSLRADKNKRKTVYLNCAQQVKFGTEELTIFSLWANTCTGTRHTAAALRYLLHFALYSYSVRHTNLHSPCLSSSVRSHEFKMSKIIWQCLYGPRFSGDETLPLLLRKRAPPLEERRTNGILWKSKHYNS